MNGRVTMADIARKAGVHLTTVSLALRDHPCLPAKTRERLQRLAKQLGYQPDPAMSALVAYRHRRGPRKDQPKIAYLTNWDTKLGWQESPAHREFFEGAKAKALSLGYQLEHFWLGEPGLSGRRMSDMLATRGIKGLIVASYRQAADSVRDFEWPKFSAVKIDFAPRELKLHMVTNDQGAIVRLAAQRVRAAGYRRVGLVMPRWWDEFVDLAWSAGFLAEQQRVPSADRVPILFYSTAQLPEGASGEAVDQAVPAANLRKWLDVNKPEVILSRGIFVRGSLAELGLVVPRDVAFADIFLEKTDGRVAGVRENCIRVGAVAVEILAGQLHQNAMGVPVVPTATFVEGTWFNGKTLPLRRRAGEPA